MLDNSAVWDKPAVWVYSGDCKDPKALNPRASCTTKFKPIQSNSVSLSKRAPFLQSIGNTPWLLQSPDH